MVINLAGQPCFFVRAVVFFAIGGAMGLVIDGAVLMKTNVAIGFSGLFL